MTTESDLTELFKLDAETKRIDAYGVETSISYVRGHDLTYAKFQLLDKTHLRRTGKELAVAIVPRDALLLATLIYRHAKEYDWPLGDLATVVPVEVAVDRKRFN